MDILEATRQLGTVLQQDERFIRYAKAKLANDKDEELQKNIGEFNIARMELDRVMGEEKRDEERIRTLNERLRNIYSEIMTTSGMAEYNAAKAELDRVMNDINNMLQQFSAGADPETCVPETACTGSCESCGGCH